MKKLLPSLLALCVPALVSAQITIDQTDFPAVGDLYFEATDTMPSASIDLGSGSSSSQSWNFTSLSQHRLDTLAFLSPSAVPNGDQFPTADMAMTQMGGYAFATISSSEVEIMGFSGDFQGLGFVLQIPFDDPQTLVKLPTTLGTNFMDTYHFRKAFKLTGTYASFVDSAMIVHTGHSSSVVDAFGTLTGPLGQFEVLRNQTTDWTTDSVFIKGGLFGPQTWGLANFQQFGQNIPNPIVDSTITYDFLEKSFGYTMVRMITDKGTGERTSARFLVNPESVSDLNSYVSVLVYPNPATDFMYVELGQTNRAIAKISNLNGQLLSEITLTEGKNEIATSGLNSGLYLLQVQTEDGKNLLNSKISVSR
ncbi:MAG: T9SS type A sorting domain-containing protein [Bacteroidia bacterium]|nr:T9SS type A sorting domain-containing protein [Bacteroidia bacterium]